MPSEVKQRKKSQKQSDEGTETSAVNDKDEDKRAKTEAVKISAAHKTSSCLDFRSIMCVVSLASCGALSWMILQQNERFSLIEEKYKLLHGKTSSLFDMEEEVLKVSKKKDFEKEKKYCTELEELKVQLSVQTVQIKAQSEKLLESQDLILNLRVEQGAVRQEMAGEMEVLQQTLQNMELKNQLQAGREDFMPPIRQEEKQEDQLCMEVNLPSTSSAAPEPEPEAESDSELESVDSRGPDDNLPAAAKKPSAFKKARHFLGLRKPKMWKK